MWCSIYMKMSHLYWHVQGRFVERHCCEIVFCFETKLRPLTAVCATDRPSVYLRVTFHVLLHVLCSPFAFYFSSFCSFSIFSSLILVFLNPSSFVLLFHGFMLFSFVRFSLLFLKLLFYLSPVWPLHHFVLSS